MTHSSIRWPAAFKLKTIKWNNTKKHAAQLERHTALRTGYNNAIRALDHVIFDDDNIDNFISSFDESAAKRPNTELQEKPAAKRHNNGNSEK